MAKKLPKAKVNRRKLRRSELAQIRESATERTALVPSILTIDEVMLIIAELDDLERRLDEALKDNQELRGLFDLQHTRYGEAEKLWRRAAPGRNLTSPDLGRLLEWLMQERKSCAEAYAKERKHSARLENRIAAFHARTKRPEPRRPG
jgi:hypothetical protein